MHLSPPIMFGVLSVVSKRFRAVGLIYQQSVEGDSRDPENKKPAQGGNMRVWQCRHHGRRYPAGFGTK
ncbi:TPA: hypothetical protein MI491_04620 [Klebsiella pneumoniae]|nr:hypothetical protein [Klebsiella pneumoniae]